MESASRISHEVVLHSEDSKDFNYRRSRMQIVAQVSALSPRWDILTDEEPAIPEGNPWNMTTALRARFENEKSIHLEYVGAMKRGRWRHDDV